MMFDNWDLGSGGWLWMIGGLVLMIGIVVLIIWAVGGYNRVTDQRTDTSSATDPLGILRARFSRGEITEAEFEQAKRILGYGK